jgi:ribosomal protein S18 acetylase RimI-like enzyme
VTNYLFANNTEYKLLTGDVTNRVQLLSFLQTTYGELYPEQQSYRHLESTVDRYLSSDTPLWFVTVDREQISVKVACLWLGIAIDQITGIRHPNIFLIYVEPSYRRQGIGRALMKQAEVWAKSQGYEQISLQVFTTNQPAIDLYASLGYEARSISMFRDLN